MVQQAAASVFLRRQGQLCRFCGRKSSRISSALALCAACIRAQPERTLVLARGVHAGTRRAFGLPLAPPETPGGVPCPLCAQGCRIGAGEYGYCRLRTAHDGRLHHLAGTPARGFLHWYRDPLPTNCVADWVCRGSQRPGMHNLAVFYASCTFNCLFCQNWTYRQAEASGARAWSAAGLAAAANAETFCVCFFGGDPASQMLHALEAGELLVQRGVAVCWETNGSSHPRLLDRAVELSLASGGCVKFDLKAYDEALHFALTGASNQRTLENFARVAGRARERAQPPLLVASTLLVPGYIEAEEVGRLARFIAALDPSIPYALLGFAPHFYMSDLPATSLQQAEAAEAAARAAGLTNVRIGNYHLLSREEGERDEVC